MERAMKVYPLSESELDMLGTLTAQITIWFAVTGIFVSAGSTLFLENVLSPEATPEGKVLLTAGPWICGVVAAATAILGTHAWVKRGSFVSGLKRQSKERQIVAGPTTTI